MALNVALLRHSFELIASRQDKITPRFYEILFARYPQAQPLFGRNSRANQAEMLQQALVSVLEHLEDSAWLEQTLFAMGRKHVDYGVTNEMYAWVGDSLLRTLAEHAGDDWSDELQAAWSDAYAAIAGLMQRGATQAEDPALSASP